MGERRPTTEIDLSIVIVNWNSAEFVRCCVQSIVAETKTITYEIIVVDNASFDGCEQHLAQDYPGVVFVQSPQNLGFGGANNLGAQRALGKVLLFLNPDTQVRKRAIDLMYGHFQGISDSGVAGCRLLNTDGSLQTSSVQALPTVLNQFLDADLLRRYTLRAKLWGARALFDEPTTPVAVEAVSGACMMIRRQVFQVVRGFSPEFFMYGEDLDLCARVTRAGFRNVYVGDCEIIHHGGGSTRNSASAFSEVMMRESVALLLRRSRGSLSSASYRVALTIAAFIRLTILMVAFPAWIGDVKRWRGACQKWFAILGWGVGVNRRELIRRRTSPTSSTV